MKDAEPLCELAPDSENRPFMVIDDGWQLTHGCACTGGPWNMGNYKFPNMKKLADDLKARNLRPGLWVRPLRSYEYFPEECILRGEMTAEGRCLDPSHPEVLKYTENMIRGIRDWGYELIKHDFSTFDIFGRWGFEMGEELTDPDWHFYDEAKTTAEIILLFYSAIRKGAGEDVLILGCNTVSHLSAGIFEIQRTGDDTSGREWERTRKMGVNTLAFRMPQNGTFYAADADCAGITEYIDWELNKQWVTLLAESGTPMFISVDPKSITCEQRDYLKRAFQIFALYLLNRLVLVFYLLFVTIICENKFVQSYRRREVIIMRKKLNLTEGIFPMPVLMVAAYNEDGSVNVMNAAWGTMQERGNVALNLTETHKTVKNIKANGAFTVSIADAAHVVEADYFGVVSGNSVSDKFENSGLTASKAEMVNAPVINEFPLCLECEFIEYQSGEYGCGVIGKVVNVTADESVMVDGQIDMSLVNAIAFDPYTHGYYKVTERVGEAFKDGLRLKK